MHVLNGSCGHSVGLGWPALHGAREVSGHNVNEDKVT